MKEQKFVLKIALGNDAMQTPEDVAKALMDVVVKLSTKDTFLLHNRGKIPDNNGNTVGYWEVEGFNKRATVS
jgi:hypothetical protein